MPFCLFVSRSQHPHHSCLLLSAVRAAAGYDDAESGREAYGCFSRRRRFSGRNFPSPPVIHLVICGPRLVPYTLPLSLRRPLCISLLLHPRTYKQQTRRILVWLRAKFAPPGFLSQDHHRIGQIGRLIIALLVTDNVYATRYDERTVLVIIQRTNYVLEELDTMKTPVYDSKDEDTSVQGMYMVDSCLLVPSTSKVHLPLAISGITLTRTWL